MSPDWWAPITVIGDDKLEPLKNYTVCFELQFVAASPVISGGYQDSDQHQWSYMFAPSRKASFILLLFPPRASLSLKEEIDNMLCTSQPKDLFLEAMIVHRCLTHK